MDFSALKIDVHNRCLQLVEEKIALLEKELAQVNEAASNETKSTAGDKHETARAMMHIEREKLSRQLLETTQLKSTLNRIDLGKNYTKAQEGAFVVTNRFLLYLAASLGKIAVNESEIMVISTASPIGKSLLGKAVTDQLNFNGKAITIEGLF